MWETDGNYLGIDTVLGETGVAVWREGEVRARIHSAVREDQAALLLPRIEAALREAGLDYDGLQGIAVSVGPGGFTSVRVGLAAARGIGFAGGIPVRGYSTLQVMRYGAGEPNAVAILPAGRGQVFFQRGEEAPRMIDREALPTLESVVTTLGNIMAAHIVAHDVSRNAERLVEMLARDVPSLPPAPLYIRPPDAQPQTSLLERLTRRQAP